MFYKQKTKKKKKMVGKKILQQKCSSLTLTNKLMAVTMYTRDKMRFMKNNDNRTVSEKKLKKIQGCHPNMNRNQSLG